MKKTLRKTINEHKRLLLLFCGLVIVFILSISYLLSRTVSERTQSINTRADERREERKPHIVFSKTGDGDQWEARAVGVPGVSNYYSYIIRFAPDVADNIEFAPPQGWSADFDDLPEVSFAEHRVVARAYNKSSDGIPFDNTFLFRFAFYGGGNPRVDEIEFYRIVISAVPPISLETAEARYSSSTADTREERRQPDTQTPSTEVSYQCQSGYKSYWYEGDNSAPGGQCNCYKGDTHVLLFAKSDVSGDPLAACQSADNGSGSDNNDSTDNNNNNDNDDRWRPTATPTERRDDGDSRFLSPTPNQNTNAGSGSGSCPSGSVAEKDKKTCSTPPQSCTEESCGGNPGNCNSCPNGFKWCYGGQCVKK